MPTLVGLVCNGMGQPAVRSGATEPTPGLGLHLRLDLAGLAIRSLCHRRVRLAHRGLVGEQFNAHRIRTRCPGAGAVLQATRARRDTDPPTTRIACRNTSAFAMASGWPKPASSPPQAARETAMTTPWARRSTGCTKPRGFIAVLGQPGNLWNWLR